MNNDNCDTIENRIKKDLQLDDIGIPSDIRISTMTIEAKINTDFIPLNIFKYINRDPAGIISVRCKKNKSVKKKNYELVEKNKTIQLNLNGKRGKFKVEKKEADFLNQVTLMVQCSSKKNNMPVSVKIFKNGTLHFTGCQTIDNMLEAAHKVFFECSKIRAILNNGMVEEISFAHDIRQLHIENLHSFKIDMINSNFSVPFRVDRPRLYNKFVADGQVARYDSNKHASVILLYKKGVTLFIFESGTIIIIIGNSDNIGFKPINEAFEFIYKYLLEHYEIIVKDDTITNSSILRYIEQHGIAINEKNHKLKHSSDEQVHISD